jgi:glycosyltransferase involved in cell wall biosynthesis
VIYAIVSNGFAYGPAQALRDFLIESQSRVVTIFHPLTREEGTRHVISTYANGECVKERAVALPVRPPRSFALDAVVPVLPPRVDAWFGFNPLACARGLLAKRRGRASFVALWSVDFAPDRFGRGTLATRIYDRLDRTCCTRADARIELSEPAREGRNRRHGLGSDVAPTHIVPMGAWLNRVATTPSDGYRQRRVAFLGHLVARVGVDVLLDALAILKERGKPVDAEVIGTGPLDEYLRKRAAALGFDGRVRFHGFIADYQKIELLLASASLGVAPYRTEGHTHGRYADPGKLKAYLAAGLPIVLTDVPPNARELEREAGAEIVDDDPAALADAIERGLASAEPWQKRRAAALAYAQRFDWNVLLADLLAKLDLNP